MTTDQGIRIRVNATTAALVLSLLGAGYSFVWSAAKVTAAVESFQATTADLRQTLNAVGSSVQDLRERVGVLEDRGNRTQHGNPLQPAQ